MFRGTDNIKFSHYFQKFLIEILVRKEQILFFLVTFDVFKTIRTIDKHNTENELTRLRKYFIPVILPIQRFVLHNTDDLIIISTKLD